MDTVHAKVQPKLSVKEAECKTDEDWYNYGLYQIYKNVGVTIRRIIRALREEVENETDSVKKNSLQDEHDRKLLEYVLWECRFYPDKYNEVGGMKQFLKENSASDELMKLYEEIPEDHRGQLRIMFDLLSDEQQNELIKYNRD